MKLYTEEQVRKAHQNGRNGGHNETYYETDEYVKSLTPIELPSDEEIEKESDRYLAPHAFREGAKWVIEQIKQQGK